MITPTGLPTQCPHGLPPHMCSLCGWLKTTPMLPPSWPWFPAGCICPTGANLVCENPSCPRKPIKATAT